MAVDGRRRSVALPAGQRPDAGAASSKPDAGAASSNQPSADPPSASGRRRLGSAKWPSMPGSRIAPAGSTTFNPQSGFGAAQRTCGPAARHVSRRIPQTAYLIFFTPRSGSYLLCEALIASRLAGFPGEYFGRDQGERLGNLWGVSSQAGYLERLFSERTTTNGVFGAKVTWRHFGSFIARSRDIEHCRDMPPAALASALLPNLHYVWLTRRDKLRQAISYSKALQTGVWSLTGPTAADRTQAQYDQNSIKALLQRTREDEVQIQKYFSENHIQPFMIVYEEFVSRYQETCVGILKYLRVEGAEGLQLESSRFVKQADMQTEEWVQRYQEEELRDDRAAAMKEAPSGSIFGGRCVAGGPSGG